MENLYIRPRYIFALTVIVLQTACSLLPRSGGYYQDDGPHARPRDISKIPDATPKKEPLSIHGNSPYTVFRKAYYPVRSAKDYRERGVASWYGKKFHGKKTSMGERYDMYAMSAAHKTLPLPCYVRVRNLRNGRAVIVRVNDRGPFLENRLIDLSYAAAGKLDILRSGTGLVEVEAIDLDEPVITRAADEPPAKVTQIFVQVGTFVVRENAEKLRAQLERADLKPVRIFSERQGEDALYRVRIGPLADTEESDGIIARAAKEGVSDAIITIE
jgi:rare lipoprotein A